MLTSEMLAQIEAETSTNATANRTLTVMAPTLHPDIPLEIQLPCRVALPIPGKIIPGSPPTDHLILEESIRRLAEEVVALMKDQTGKSRSLRKTQKELRLLRMDLGSKLYKLKALNAKTGRDGRWAETLRECNLSRTSADRYIERYLLQISPSSPLASTDLVAPPSKEKLTILVKRHVCQLTKVLTTEASIIEFISQLETMLRASYRMVEDLTCLDS